jgi:5-methylcytosine-specific restriction endonuclease McrA
VKHHTKVYLKHFGYGEQSFIECEVCGRRANDTHHIDSRGMGGDPTGKKDVIENLMALCRTCHEKYGDKEQYMDFLKERHKEYMEVNEL